MLERLKNEPVALVAIAAGIIVLGLDIGQVTDTVELLIELLVLAGGAKIAREQVVPERKLHPTDYDTGE